VEAWIKSSRFKPWLGTFLDKKLTLAWPLSTQGQVVRKPVSANPGLKVNQSTNFSCLNVFSTDYVLCSLRLIFEQPSSDNKWVLVNVMLGGNPCDGLAYHPAGSTEILLVA